ncbi:MAG: phosphogluconate dehydratase [Pseudomonadota bacterium]
MAELHPEFARVTERVRARSQETRARYVAQMRAAAQAGPHRSSVSCGNLAHAAAACGPQDKKRLAKGDGPNIAIVTAYNDMLSAHQPLGTYPEIIKDALREIDATAQIAGGVPAMCDGVTQGMPGMDLSLFSRDVIAMATAVSLSHNVFDGALMLGVCDKIVPGLFMGAARFGHLPIAFLPAGPMASGLSNDEKVRVRQAYAAGDVGREDLLAAESASYHSPGTCTFYGTANSNQMMMEIMGLHVPGSAFVNPGTPLRDLYVRETARQVAATTALGETYTPFFEVIDERAILNAVIGLHATGGSTNHTIHLIAMARSVGVYLNWDDLSDLSAITPTLSRIYPNGSADVNHFHAAGGLGFVIRELIDHGLLHEDVTTVMGKGLDRYAVDGHLDGARPGHLRFEPALAHSADLDIVRPTSDPVSPTGGLVLLSGNVGRAVIKVSAVATDRRVITAPAIIFASQQDLMDRFKAGALEQDFVAVLPFQGPKANGMPELHKLNPPLGVLQQKGFKIALITDGRMSGASGKVPSAIHLTPEALDGGTIARLRDGDEITLDAQAGTLSVAVAPDVLAARTPMVPDLDIDHWGTGRELFAGLRALVTSAEEGAMTLALKERPHDVV